jgi:LuxR family transcriptional regulator, maltose regulon positive regulatory protein
LCGDLDGGDLSLEDAVGVGEEVDSPDDLALALCERSLVAMARNQWDRTEVLAERARTVLRRTGYEENYATPLICALRARAAMHRGDVPAARQELVTSQRLRPLLTYALPYLAVQARIELARVHLALADQAGARTLMREVDDLLRRRPRLGTLVGDAETLRAQLSKERGSIVPGASALTAAELRLLPLLSTHLSRRRGCHVITMVAVHDPDRRRREPSHDGRDTALSCASRPRPRTTTGPPILRGHTSPEPTSAESRRRRPGRREVSNAAEGRRE